MNSYIIGSLTSAFSELLLVELRTLPAVVFCHQTQVPLAQQQILFNGKEIPNSSRLNASGVGDNDLLMLVSARVASR